MILRLKGLDEKKYKYDQDTQSWTPFGRAEVDDESKMAVEHDDGVNTGLYWMKKPVSFKTAKMTNNRKCNKKYVSIYS